MALSALTALANAGVARAADLTARQVAVTLHKAASGEVIDFSGRDLSELDLAGIDFKGASLANVNLYGADLSRANLSRAQLPGAKLDRAVLTRTDFTAANLEGATILKPSVYTTPDFNISESPIFADANLKRARIAARLDGANFRGADLSGAKIGPFDMSVEGGLAPSSLMKGADFTQADLSGVEIRNVNFTFGRFAGAKLLGARLVALDLTRADFSGADLTGAAFTDCVVEGASFAGAIGLQSVKGLPSVQSQHDNR